MKCNFCNVDFKNVTSLASHLTHPKSKCKINVKKYYDTFLRKEGEGICKFCGEETSFGGLNIGYSCNICKHCRNNDPKSKKIRTENCKKKKEIRKISEGYYNQPEQCQICLEKEIITKTRTRSGLARHITQVHPEINLENYYNQYLSKYLNENICKITGEKTKFKNLKEGYFNYRGKGINSRDPEIQKKKQNTIFKNYGVLNPCFVHQDQRIENYKKSREESRELRKERWNLISLLRKLTIDESDKLQCQICGKKFNGFYHEGTHIFRSHKLSMKHYYDKFFKNIGEGICPISNLETNFDCLERGYFKYHKLFTSYCQEIQMPSKNFQQKYIHDKIKSYQPTFNVEFIDIESLNLIGDLTKIKCLKCNSIYENRFTNLMIGYGKCPRCYPRNTHTSLGEDILLNDIRTITKNETILGSYTGLIKNPKTDRPLEIDIYLPDKKFAIEFNGLYWHSELILNENAQNYHSMKWNECRKVGVQLFQVFEDEWLYKKDLILAMIKHKLGLNFEKTIYGRKCEVKEIEPSIKNDFLDNNHIQGKDSSKIKLGLFYNNELVSVMTFGFGNITRGGNPKDLDKWELSRFCSKKEYHVIGSAGKLLEFFKRNYDWKEIYTYADLRFSNGNVYKQLGFEFLNQTQPNYFYVKGMKRIHRYNLRKLPTEPIEIPEWKLRMDQGYCRIWDCGNLKFSLLNN